MNMFIDYKTMISEKKEKYPFIIGNTDSEDKHGTHWWSIMNIEPKTDLLFFDTFGVDGLKSFIIQYDQKVIEKILFGTEQLTRTNKKITLVSTKFSLNTCKNLSKNELDNLSDTARDFFYFVQFFRDKLKLRDFVNLWVVEDRIQDLDIANCGIFQIYFYDNLFNPDQNSKIQNRKKLNKKTMEMLVNELFVLNDQRRNEAIIEDYAYKRNIMTK